MAISEDIIKFLDRVKAGEVVEFEETIALIDQHFKFTPCRFVNGVGEHQVISDAGVNNGSLKILTFASKHCLTEAETLQLFGKFYREDVLLHPEGLDHRNIRAFIESGWAGVHFDGEALDVL